MVTIERATGGGMLVWEAGYTCCDCGWGWTCFLRARGLVGGSWWVESEIYLIPPVEFVDAVFDPDAVEPFFVP